MIGAELLGYRIEALVGRGGMGVVYRACDLRLKRRVALKLIAPEVAGDARFRERFLRETELAASLEHPNVVPIHDAGEGDGRLFLAMRLVDGTDLGTVLRSEGALAPRRALAIGAQLSAALDAAHASGLVHRDVKPSNVLLDAREHVYLADFGLSRRLATPGAPTNRAHSLGTPAYAAPEQIEGRAVDGRADVYSLGCLLFECLTGSTPFRHESRLAVAWAHLEEEPPRASERRPGLPEAIDEVIATAMAKAPEQRHATCAALVAAAQDALGLGPPAAPRRRLLLIAAFAAFAVLAAVAMAFASRDEGGSSLVARGDTLVRIDPRTETITAVADLDGSPVATAAAGRNVWVLGGDGLRQTLAEVDPATAEVRHTTPISTSSYPDPLSGPVLTADEAGAWVIGLDAERRRYVLTRVMAGGGEAREYPLDRPPTAVAYDDGALWVLLSEVGASALLRVDARSGAVTRRLNLRAPARRAPLDGLAIDDGRAWVMASGSATLQRVDLASGRTRERELGSLATPPVVGFGAVWLCVTNPGSSMLRLDPRTLRDTLARNSIPAEDGRFSVGYGSLWRHDVPSGTVMRFDPRTGSLAGTIRVTANPPDPDGTSLTVTAIAAGAGGVWAAVGRG